MPPFGQTSTHLERCGAAGATVYAIFAGRHCPLACEQTAGRFTQRINVHSYDGERSGARTDRAGQGAGGTLNETDQFPDTVETQSQR